MLELIYSGVGIGWLPRSIASAGIRDGSLVNLDDRLQKVSLYLTACRLKEQRSDHSESLWRVFQDYARIKYEAD